MQLKGPGGNNVRVPGRSCSGFIPISVSAFPAVIWSGFVSGIPARPAGLPFKLLKASLRHAAPLALLLGRAVFIIRERDTAGFNRKKQIKAQ